MIKDVYPEKKGNSKFNNNKTAQLKNVHYLKHTLPKKDVKSIWIDAQNHNPLGKC